MTYIFPEEAIKEALRMGGMFGSLKYYNNESGYDSKVESLIDSITSTNYSSGTVEFSKSEFVKALHKAFDDVSDFASDIGSILNHLCVE